MSNFWRYFFIFLFASVVLVFAAGFSLFDDRLHLVFCDVGQGDAILIYQGSTQVLVDGGPDRSVLSCLSRHMPFWDRKIEVLVLTNPDLDHYGGFIDVLKRYQINTFLTSGVSKNDTTFQELEKEIRMGVVRDVGEGKVRVMGVEAGDKINLGKMSFLTFWPTAEYLGRLEPQETTGHILGARTSDNPNEFSVVLGLSYGQFDSLLTGDIQPPATNQLAGELRDMREWEVLKVPHHGSKNGLTRELLEAVNPKLAVISVGKKNRYGHPAPEIVKLLKEKGVRVLRTDNDGEIEIGTDGREWGLR